MYLRNKSIQLISLKSFHENILVLQCVHEHFYSMNIKIPVIFNKKTNELFLFFQEHGRCKQRTLALIVLFFINCDRSVEILYAAAVTKANKMSEQLYSLLKLLPNLNVGRQELALFQHHDAITGTSRKTVTENYRKRYCMLIRKIHFGKNLALIIMIK